jgi:Fur family zinc uptake transcriptional regulator
MQKLRATDRRLAYAAEVCARHGVQLTALRQIILTLILDAEGPVTAYKLLDRLKEIRKGAVPPTIYRALDFFMEQGLVHKVERLNAFVACIDSDHRHHAAQFLICKSCGTVAEIEDRSISNALKRAAEKQGFCPDNAMVELAGTCAACAAAAP